MGAGEGLQVRLKSLEGGIQPVLGRREQGHLEVGSGRLSLLLLAGGARLTLLDLLLSCLAMLLLGLWLLLLALLSASSVLGLKGLELLLSVLSLLVLLDSGVITLSLLLRRLESGVLVQLLLLLLHLLLHLRLGRLRSHLQLMLMLAHGGRLGLSSRHCGGLSIGRRTTKVISMIARECVFRQCSWGL